MDNTPEDVEELMFHYSNVEEVKTTHPQMSTLNHLIPLT